MKDLCARLPYEVKCLVNFDDGTEDVMTLKTGLPNCFGRWDFRSKDYSGCSNDFKPYLRSMSTMTESEMDELRELCGGIVWKKDILHDEVLDIYYRHDALDWLLKHHFDTRGLIGMGLALEAPEGMYDEMSNIQKL